MPLTPGTRLGPYEILAPLGSGASGQVFRARDMRLGRDVAIKVLSRIGTGDSDALARFDREARMLAALNHPHIAQIYGVEEADGVRAIAMELVEGPTLAEIIAGHPVPDAASTTSSHDDVRASRATDVPQRPVPPGIRALRNVDAALQIARQIAAALEAAHSHGIVHRDLKPSNIKVTPHGNVKVLDFGLAKELPRSATGGATTTSPVVTTHAGAVLGTPAYMSPEQARGRPADKRSDLWAFGCVLYELLTGVRVFDGDNIPDTLAAITRDDPDWSKLPPDTPSSVRRLLRRCLARDPKSRLADAGDALLDLNDTARDPVDSPGRHSKPLPARERAFWAGALALVLLAATLVFLMRPVEPPPALVRADLVTPLTTDPVSFALAPDGRSLVFLAQSDGLPQLWLRSLDTGALRALSGTSDASRPFWAPDGKSIGFFAERKLKRIDADGTGLRVLADAPSGTGGTWSTTGVIVFAPDSSSTLSRVAAAGGPVTVLTHSSKEAPPPHRGPQFLQDGHRYLYFSGASRGVIAGTLENDQVQRIADADVPAILAPSGHLLTVRQSTLYAQKINQKTLALEGEPSIVVGSIAIGGTGAGVMAGVSAAAGALAYRTGPGTAVRQFAWVDRAGRVLRPLGDPEPPASPPLVELAPDGRHAAVTTVEGGNVANATEIALIDTERGVIARLGVRGNLPVWSPDGSEVAFLQGSAGGTSLVSRRISGGDQMTIFKSAVVNIPWDWSPDGKWLIYTSNASGESRTALWATAVSGGGTPVQLTPGRAVERAGEVSPNGRWLAYESDESGRFEIYLQPFPGPGTRMRVSTAGGAQVRWRGNGSELFYVALGGELMSVTVSPSAGDTADVGTATPLFATRIGGALHNGRRLYAPSADGKEFLMYELAGEGAAPITLVLNWR